MLLYLVLAIMKIDWLLEISCLFMTLGVSVLSGLTSVIRITFLRDPDFACERPND